MRSWYARRYSLYALLILGCLVLAWFLHRPRPPAPPPSHWHAPPASVEAFQDRRFGIMVTWGPASLTGQEISWSRAATRPGEEGQGDVPVEIYDTLYQRFNPAPFDADGWVRLFRQAGARYVVWVAKHHDGFCMFDSALTDYSIARSPYGRDITAEFARACHAAGMSLGFYYSPPDWRHPDYRTDRHERYIPYLHGQVRELCTKYGRLDVLWFDGLFWRVKDWDSEGLFRLVRSLQPEVVVNDRAALPGDFETPEQFIGAYGHARPWETCLTMGGQWSYRPDDAYKSPEELVRTLVACAGRGGNLLLNVGPTPEGEIPPEQAERLAYIGAWLERYGESIYGTRAGPMPPQPWGVTTRRGSSVYMHITDPDVRRVQVPIARDRIVAAVALTPGSVEVVDAEAGAEVRFESAAASGEALSAAPSEPVVVIRLEWREK